MENSQTEQSSDAMDMPHQAINPPRILVVEDDAEIRQLNVDSLSQSGYHVDAAVDWLAAWKALQVNRYDLLVTDNNMPGMSGIELLRKLGTTGRTMPVIMDSGTVPNQDTAHRPDSVLFKPYSLDQLLAVVKSVLGRSQSPVRHRGNFQWGNTPSLRN